MDVQLTELGTHRDVLVMGQILITKKHHQVVEQGTMNNLEGLSSKRLAEIQAMNLGANMAGKRFNPNAVVGHSILSPCFANN
jgi:hypothetical protein